MARRDMEYGWLRFLRIMKNARHLIIGIGIAAFAIYYTFKNVSIIEILGIIASIKYLYLIPALLLITISFVFRAYRWSCLVSSIKYVEVKRIYSPLMIGFMGNLLPARAGEFMRAYLLGKREDISFSASFATIVVERLFDILAMLCVASVFMFASENRFSRIIVMQDISLMDMFRQFGLISISICVTITGISLIMLYFRDFFNTVVQYITRPLPAHIADKIIHLLDSFSEGLMILKDFRGFVLVIVYTIGVWLPMIFSYYAFYKVFGIDNLPLISIPILTVVVCIFITVFPTPGFVGSFQAGCVVVLHNIFNVPESVAASFGIITWFVNMGYVALAGTYFVLKDNVSFKDMMRKE